MSATYIYHHPNFHPPNYKPPGAIDVLHPLRRWIKNILVKNARFAHFICQVIPCCSLSEILIYRMALAI